MRLVGVKGVLTNGLWIIGYFRALNNQTKAVKWLQN
jgi:hypothetical protein